ncbi:hypothetical protein Tco_1246751 [Tanacetum coccineum]
MYSCELCGNDSHHGYDCPPRFPLVYEQEPSYNQNFSDNYYPQNSSSFPQQYLFCTRCGGPHESFQCQPMNQNYFEPNPIYNSSYSGFDQPPQYSINHKEDLNQQRINDVHNGWDKIDELENELFQMIQSFCEKFLQQKQAASIDQSPLQEMSLQEMEDLKQHYLDEMLSLKLQQLEQAAKVSSQYWKPPIYYDDDDDDEESSIPLRDIISELPLSVAIAPVLPTKEPDHSLSMRDEHLSTIPKMESDEVIKSSVEDLVLIPSESEDLSDNKRGCDVPFCDESYTIPQGNDSNHFDAESDLIESLLNRDTSIVYSPKIDSLLEEFAGELAYIDLLPPKINEADFDPEEDIRLVEQLLYDNSPPLDALKDYFEIFFDSNDDCTSSDDNPFYSEDIDYVEASPPDSELVSLEEDDILREKLLNINLLIAKIQSLNDNPTPSTDFMLKSPSSFPIPVEDSDFFLEKSETFLSLPELETFRFDNEEKNSGSTTIQADISLLEYDCFYFEIEPELGELTRVVVEDIYDNSTRELHVYVPNILPTLPTLYPVFDTLLPFSSENEDKVFNPGILISKEENSPHLLSHRGFKVFQLINDSKSSMMIYGGDIPILDVPYLHFYPP